MNRIISLMVFVMLFFYHYEARSQKYKAISAGVPEAVTKAFKELYPDIFPYEWEFKKKKNIYEAEFILVGVKHEAYFSPDGQWLWTEKDVERSEVPQEVWDSFGSSEYTSWKIDDIEEHHTPDHDVMYEIEVKLKQSGRKQKKYLYYLPNGTLLQVIDK